MKEADECKVKTIPNQCTRVYMVTDYDHHCPHDDDRFVGKSLIKGSPPSGPLSFKKRSNQPGY